MNIAKILKNCPKETKLYSPIYGEVWLSYVDFTIDNCIIVKTYESSNVSFASDGRYNINYDGECMLFPSKENRDWSTFKAPKKEYEFKPFDKVLVRDFDNDVWKINFFAYISISNYKYQAMAGAWKQCIPFKGNEHLLGTSNPA